MAWGMMSIRGLLMETDSRHGMMGKAAHGRGARGRQAMFWALHVTSDPTIILLGSQALVMPQTL